MSFYFFMFFFMFLYSSLSPQSVSGFRVEQLEARLQCLDSLCVSWLSEAARCEEKLLREKKTRLLLDDINQVCTSPYVLYNVVQ